MNIEYTNVMKNQVDIYKLYESLGWNKFLDLNETQLRTAMKNSYKVVYAYDGEKWV